MLEGEDHWGQPAGGLHTFHTSVTSGTVASPSLSKGRGVSRREVRELCMVWELFVTMLLPGLTLHPCRRFCEPPHICNSLTCLDRLEGFCCPQ